MKPYDIGAFNALCHVIASRMHWVDKTKKLQEMVLPFEYPEDDDLRASAAMCYWWVGANMPPRRML